jgi:hypothetical protein
MCSTAKDRLHKLKDLLDHAFTGLTPSDARELTKELREHLTLIHSAANRSLHDTKTNSATDHAL